MRFPRFSSKPLVIAGGFELNRFVRIYSLYSYLVICIFSSTGCLIDEMFEIIDERIIVTSVITLYSYTNEIKKKHLSRGYPSSKGFEAMLLTPGLGGWSSAKKPTLRKKHKIPTPHVFYSAAGEGRERGPRGTRRDEARRGERERQRCMACVVRVLQCVIFFDVTTSYNSMEPAARTKKHDSCGVTSL